MEMGEERGARIPNREGFMNNCLGEDVLLYLGLGPGEGQHLPADVHTRQVGYPHLQRTILKNRMNSSFSLNYPGSIHPILQIVLVQNS